MTDICIHLQRDLSLPMALLHDGDSAAYLCSACTVETAHAFLAAKSNGSAPQTLADSLHIGSHCEHAPDGQTCYACRDTIFREMSRAGLRDVVLRIVNRPVPLPDMTPAEERAEVARERGLRQVEAARRARYVADLRRTGYRGKVA